MRDAPPSELSEVGAIPVSMYVLVGPFTLATCADSCNRRACSLTTVALFSHQTMGPSGAAPESSIHTRALAKHPGTKQMVPPMLLHHALPRSTVAHSHQAQRLENQQCHENNAQHQRMRHTQHSNQKRHSNFQHPHPQFQPAFPSTATHNPTFSPYNHDVSHFSSTLINLVIIITSLDVSYTPHDYQQSKRTSASHAAYPWAELEPGTLCALHNTIDLPA